MAKGNKPRRMKPEEIELVELFRKVFGQEWYVKVYSAVMVYLTRKDEFGRDKEGPVRIMLDEWLAKIRSATMSWNKDAMEKAREGKE